ncbi:MAG: hypothetical protein QOG20_1798 [Pseudonocardiales bacterium]|uniref:NmrA family NAD(P)-binding protein n=1 Tax=Pseudonocardia sp. TaxID=60912 RepID=UPI002614B5FC|nr:NmrA family NAD(P)-binding protein [Pseudonocardia sp.]MCW2717035.1 hypothetical protein [Pseudonocardia sp.]MDT7618814.1 hypothetical protein [Pseudonocardiales bacterium]MDT7706191.1 hypothetical protein [Pseudonocardiales bacterium]
MILVTGATGRVGYRVAEYLTEAGARATAMVRVPARVMALPRVAGHIVSTLGDPPPPDTLQAFDRVFLMSPAGEAQEEMEVVFVDALVAAGHRPHVVKLATDGFQDLDCDVRFMRSHRGVARHLEATGLPVTYVAACPYMENLLAWTDEIRENGLLSAPVGRGRVGFVAARDVAATAAHALMSCDGDGPTYVVTGPEALTYADVAKRISAVFARQVDHAESTPSRTRSALRAKGVGPWECEGMLEMFDWIRHGGCNVVTGDVRDVTGENPRPIERWLGKQRGAFLGAPSGASYF